MSIFDLRESIVYEYGKYVQSFLSIADERVRAFIEESLLRNQALWPDSLVFFLLVMLTCYAGG